MDINFIWAIGILCGIYFGIGIIVAMIVAYVFLLKGDEPKIRGLGPWVGTLITLIMVVNLWPRVLYERYKQRRSHHVD